VLNLLQFERDEATDVWVPPAASGGVRPFAYSDGEHYEQHVLNAIRSAEDVGDNAPALASAATDWPSYYHLAPGRSNAFRSLGLPHDLTILELGAGCGALSRHLGEQHAQVHSVEGSLRRATICRARCRDLDNVAVFCADFSSLALPAAYDVVVLNGVLEYAPSFLQHCGDEDPAAALIRFARSVLKPGGIVVVGIENKLGLKYWCGAPEDHTSTLYEGIHGYPSRRDVVTFSRRELSGLLSDAGFGSIQYFYCFPDYKFTSTVFSDPMPPNLWLHNWIDYPAETPGLARQYSIHEALAAKTLYDAGVLADAANSFLVVAGLDGAADRFARTFTPSWIAKRLSVRDRDKTYHRVTTLRRDGEQLTVKKEALTYASLPMTPPDAVTSPWTPGELLLLEMSRLVVGQAGSDAMVELLDEYHREIMARFPSGKTDAEGYPLLQSRCVDFMLRNLIRGPQGLVAIDLEWVSPDPIPADFMLFRCLWHDVIGANYAWASRGISDFDRFMVRLVQRFYPAYGYRRHARNKARERGFLADVGQRPVESRQFAETALWMAGRAFVGPVARLLRQKIGFAVR
jgi:SAM-dependent methyltransferase